MENFKINSGVSFPTDKEPQIISPEITEYERSGNFIQSQEDFAKSISHPGDSISDLINKIQQYNEISETALAQGLQAPSIGPGYQIDLNKSIDRLQNAFNPDKPTLRASARPDVIGSLSDYERYAQSKDFQSFGYVPSLGSEQEYKYGRAMSWGDTIGKAFAGGGALAADTFIEGWKGWSRMAEALFTWDSSKLMGSKEERYEIAKKQEEIFNKYAIYRTEESEDTLLNRQFFGNMLQQTGFTVGTIAQTALETYLTRGIGKIISGSVGAFAKARGLKNAVNLAELVNDTRKASDLITKSERVVNTLKNIPRAIIPLYGKTEDLFKLHKAGAGMWQLGLIGAGGIKRELSIFNMARSEAIFEAASTYKDMEDRLVSDFYKENGREPNESELEKIRNTADKASSDNFVVNTGILTVMNRIQFGNMIKSFDTTRKIFTEGLAAFADDTFEVIGKVGDKTVKRTYQKGFFGSLGATKDIATIFGKKKAAWEATKSIGRGMMKFEGSEGVQELLQEASNKGLSNYYYDLYNGKSGYGTKIDSIISSIENPLTNLDAAKTFLMGALTGRFIAPFSYAAGKINLTKESKDIAAKKAEAIKIINSFYADPTQYIKEQIANVKVQNKAAETMEEAVKNQDRYTFNNIKDSAFAKGMAAAIKLNLYDSFKDTLKEFAKEMTPEEFQKAFNIDPNEGNRKDVNQFVEKIISQMDDYYTVYNNLRDKYGDRILPELYKNNSPEEYKRAKRAKVAQDQAIEMLTTNLFRARQSTKRAVALTTEIASNPNLGSSATEIVNKLGSEQALEDTIKILNLQINSLEKAEELSPEQKELLAQKKEELELATIWKTNYESIMAADDENYTPAIQERAYDAFGKLINFYNKVSKKNTTVTREDIDDNFLKIVDYILLNRDSKNFTDAMNLLADPYNMDLIKNAIQNALEEMGERAQEQHRKEVESIGSENKIGKVSEELGVQEGKEYLTQATAESRVYKGSVKTTAYKQDIIKVVEIKEDSISFTVNNDGELISLTNEEFAEIGKLYPMESLTPEQRIYFRNRNVVFDINVRAKSGKRHLIKGTHADRDYSSAGVNVKARLELTKESQISSEEPVLVFDETTGKYYYEEGEQKQSFEYILRVVYINPVTKKTDSFEYDPDYLKKYASNKTNLFAITESETEYLKRVSEKRRLAQIDILNSALDELLTKFDTVAEQKKENQKKWIDLKEELAAYLMEMDKIQQDIANLPPRKKKGAKTKERKNLEEAQQKLIGLIAKTEEAIKSYEIEIDNLEKELETIEKIYEAYTVGITELKSTGVPYTRDQTGSIVPQDITQDINEQQQNQLIKPKRNISNEKLDQMITDTEGEIAILNERIAVLNELLDRLNKLTKFDQIPDIIDAFENIDDKQQLLSQLNMIKRQEINPEKKQIVQNVINLLVKKTDSIETAYLFDIADRYSDYRRELNDIQNKLQSTEEKLLRLYTAKEQRDSISQAQERASMYNLIQNELIRQYKIRRERAGIKQEVNKVIISVGSAPVTDDLIKGPDAILTTQVIEDVTPDGQLEKESFTTVEGRVPILTETALFKTAGRHFADLEDTQLNSPEDARFFKFTESATLRDSNGSIYYLMPITKDSKEFQELRITSWEEDGKTVKYDDDIRLVVVKRDSSGQFRPVDVAGNILQNPTKDNMVYTALLGHPDLLSADTSIIMSWLGKNFVNKNKLSDKEVLAIVNRFKTFRETVKERIKNNEQVFLPVEDKSPGTFNREPLGYTDSGDLRPQELSLEGRLIEDNPDFENLRHPDGSSVKLTVSTFNGKVRAGRLLMVKDNDPNSSILVYNRKFTEEEQENLISVLKRMAELFEMKALDLMSPDEDTEFQLGIKYLQGVIHWFSPKEGFTPYSFQMWVKNGLHLGQEVIDFTPDAIDKNRDIILEAIPYHKVNNAMLSDKRANDAFTEIKVINGKILGGTKYTNYQHYLLANREGGPVVYTNIKPYSAPKADNLESQDYQLKNVYLKYSTTGVLEEEASVSEEDIPEAPIAESPTGGVKTYSINQNIVKLPNGDEMFTMTNNIPLGPKLTFVRKRADGTTNLYVHTEYVDGKFKVVQVIDENGNDLTNRDQSGRTLASVNEEIINTVMESINDTLLQTVTKDSKNIQDSILNPFKQTFISIEDFAGKGNKITATKVATITAPITAVPADDPAFEKFVIERYNIYADDIVLSGETPIPLDQFSDIFQKQLRIEYKAKAKPAAAISTNGVSKPVAVDDASDYLKMAQLAIQEDDDVDPNARVNNPNAVSKEDIDGFKSWMSDNLPQFMVEVFDSLIDGRYMGQFYNGTVRMYQNAEEGTGFHEAFEAVWNALLTPEQQQAMIAEYKNRPDWNKQDNYKWAVANYPYLSEAGKIKEALAEEFREYMLSNASNIKAQSPKRNTWFRKLWNFIKNLIGLGDRRQVLDDKIQSVFSRIASGGYKNQDILPSYDPTLKSNKAIKGTSVEFTQLLMEGMTATFFDLLYSNDANVQQLFDKKNNLFDDYFKKTYNKVFNTFNPGLKVILNNEKFQQETPERQLEEIRKYKAWMHSQDPMFDMKDAALKVFNTEVKEQFKKYLTQFGLSFTTAKANDEQIYASSPVGNVNEEVVDELMSKEETANAFGIRDVIYVDPTTLTNPSVRLLILSLTADKQDVDGKVIEKEKNQLGLTTLVPYKRKMNILLNELSNIVVVHKKQEDGTFVSVSALDSMVEKLKDKYSDPIHKARFKSGYEWISKLLKRLKYDQLKQGQSLTDDELRLLLAFENAFNRNRNIPLKVIVGADGRLRHVDAISVNTVQKIKEEWRNNVKDKAVKSDINNLANADMIFINPGGFIEVNLQSKRLDIALNASNFREKLEALSRLGIKFTLSSDKISASDQSDIESAFNSMRGVLKERKAKNLPFMYSEFFDRKTVEGPLNALLAIEANVRSEDTLLSHLTPEGKTQYAITLPSELSNIINSMAGVQTLEEFIASNPQYGSVTKGVIVLNPYQRSSQILKPGGMFFDAKGNKIFDRETGDFKTLKYEYIQGMASDQTNEGDNTDSLTFNDKITQEIYHIMRGTYFSIINSDKSSEFGINMGYFIKPDEVNNMRLIEDKYLDALRDEVMHALTFHFSPNYIKEHQSRILMLGHFSGILGFQKDGNGSQFQKYFDNLVKGTKVTKKMKRDVVEQLYTTIADNFVSTVRNEGAIKKYLDKQIAEHKEWLLSREIVVKDEATNKYKTFSIPVDNRLMGNEVLEMNDLRYNQLVTFLTVNRQLAVFEQHKLFYGHPALYKELPKRSNGANSQKNSISENADIIRLMNQSKPRYDGREREADRPVVKSVTYADVNVTSSKLTSIAEALFKGFEPFIGKDKAQIMIGASFSKTGKLEKLNVKKGSLLQSYIDMTEADGQSYIMPDYFRDLLYLSSGLTKDQEALLDYENAQEIMERKDPSSPYYKKYSNAQIAKAEEILKQPKPDAIIQPLKPQGFGFSLTPGMSHINMLKNSVFPLTWSRVKFNPTMRAKYIDAQNAGTDVINFVSGHKLGAITKPDGTLVSMYNQDGSVNTEIPVQIDLISKYIGIQVETPSYAKEKVIFGSQVRKIILSNLPKELEPFREEYMAVIDELISIEREQLLKELGLSEEDGVYTAKDLSQMMSTMREQAVRRGMPDNVLDMMETYFVKDLGEQLKYPLDANPARERIEYVLQAMVDTRIIRMEMFGKSSVQVASTMWEKGNRNLLYLKDDKYEAVTDFNKLTTKEKKSVKLTSNDLKFYDGENAYIEVYVPWYFDGVDPGKAGFTLKDGIWTPNSLEAMEKVLSAIGFRIPTQGFNAIESIRIKGFLDPSYGDMVVVPSEMVGKSGSDFDIDKLNMFLANYKIGRSGELMYVNYSTSEAELNQRYIAYVNRKADEDVRKMMYALSSDERKAVKDKFKDELDRINAEADLNYKNTKNSLYNDYRESKQAAVMEAEEDTDSYFKELFAAGKKQYWKLTDDVRQTFVNVKKHIIFQKIQGPREIQLYLEHAIMMQESGMFTEDEPVLKNMIKLYQEELRVLGHKQEVINKHYAAALETFRKRKGELRDMIKSNRTISVMDLIEDDSEEMQTIYLEMAIQMGRLNGLETLEEFSKFSLPKQNGKKSLQNRLIEIMKSIIEHPSNRRQLLVPNSTARLKSISEMIVSLRGATQVESDMTKLSEWKSMAETRETFVTSKQLVGAGALQITSQVMSQIGEVELSGSYKTPEGETKNVNIKLPNSNTLKMDLTVDADSEIIFDLLSEALSGSVDAAKDPFIFELRLNLETAGIWFYLTKRGVSQENLALFFNQPAINDFFKARDINRTFVSEVNDNYLYFNEVVLKAAKKYYEQATGQIIPADEFPKNTIRRFQAMQSQYNSYKSADMVDMIKNANKLTKEQAGMQVAMLMDMLDYRDQSNLLSNFIRGIAYDTARTKSMVENRLQKLRYNKMMNEGFITKASVQRVFDRSFLGQIKKIKDDVENMFAEFFVSLQPKTLPVFDPLMNQLDNEDVFMSNDDRADLLNRYQSFVLGYILQNTPYGKEKAIAMNYELFQDTKDGVSLPKLLKKIKERYPNNIALKNLFPIINDNRNATDNIKLFNNKMSAYDINLMSESMDSLKTMAQANGDMELQKFVDNVAKFTILQSGLQLSPITFTKVMPLSLYADVAAKIFRAYAANVHPIDVDNIWRAFHQNYAKNKNIVPTVKLKKARFDSGLLTMVRENKMAGYDYVKVYVPKEGVTREILKNEYIPIDQKYTPRLFEKIKIMENGEDVTAQKPVVRYRPINMLGNGMYVLETSPGDLITGQSRFETINEQIDESIYQEAVEQHIQDMLDVVGDSDTPQFDKLPRHDKSVATMTYAGIGSRETPQEILNQMKQVAVQLDNVGFTVNTGNAKGADAAFRESAKKKNVFFPADATDVTKEIALEIHPKPEALQRIKGGVELMARNTNQVFGENLDAPVDFVLAYDPSGWEGEGPRPEKGGTNQAIDMAARKGIPVINMANPGWKEKLEAILNDVSKKQVVKPVAKSKVQVAKPVTSVPTKNTSASNVLGSIKLNIIENWVQKGQATTTVRSSSYHDSFYKGDGQYSTEAGNIVNIKYRGQVKVQGNNVVGNGFQYTKDEFAAAEGFGNWTNFTKEAKYAGRTLINGGLVHLYDIKPLITNTSNDNSKTPIEGLNQRLDAYGNATLVFSSDFFQGERPKGKLSGFKTLLSSLKDNIVVLADVNWNDFDFFLSKQDIEKLNALKPLAEELDTINTLKISSRDTRTVAVEKRFAQLSNQLVNNFVDIVGKHVKQQLGKTITSSKPRVSATAATDQLDEQIRNSAAYKEWLATNSNPMMTEQENLDYYKQCKLQ